MKDIQSIKEKQEESLRKHLNVRDKSHYKKKNSNTDEKKDEVYKEIIAVTEQIKAIRKEMRLCNKIEKSIPVIKNEIRKLEERENRRKEMTKSKKKDRMYER